MYTVGSLADLISGNETPNKQSVQIKEVKYEKPIVDNITKKQKDGKKKKDKKKSEQNTETPMEATENVVKEMNYEKPRNEKQKDGKQKKKKDKKKSEQNTETPMETTENIIQNQNLNNAEKRKMLKRKANELDAPKKDSNKKNKMDEEQPEDLEKDNDRTIFIGNVPLSTKEKDFKKFFSSFGEIETLRFRGIPPADMKTPKKVAFMKKQFHPKRKTMIAYVCYKSSDSAVRATEADGQKFNNFHLRVEYLNEKIKYDNKKTIFLGNVPFDAEEEDVRKVFEDCGIVTRVRLVRDKRTNMGKGFGYVNFDNSDAVDLALQLGSVEIGKREVRIMRCTKEDQNKNKTAEGRKARERFAIYIFDLPENTTERDLYELFGKCGKILSTRIVHSDQIHCFVNFEDSEGVKNAVNMHNPRLHGVPVNVRAKMQKNNEQKPAIYIRNLPLKTTKEELHEIFKDCGAISFIRLFLKKTRPTGVGFVNFEEEDAIEKALEKKVKIGNSELMITRKTDKPKMEEKPEQLENLIEEDIEQEAELINDLTSEKKWDDDVSSSDEDEESETNESPSILTKESKMSEDVESGVESDNDEEDKKELDKILMEEDEESDDSDDDEAKKRPKKVTLKKCNLKQAAPKESNGKPITPNKINSKPLTPKSVPKKIK